MSIEEANKSLDIILNEIPKVIGHESEMNTSYAAIKVLEHFYYTHLSYLNSSGKQTVYSESLEQIEKYGFSPSGRALERINFLSGLVSDKTITKKSLRKESK